MRVLLLVVVVLAGVLAVVVSGHWLFKDWSALNTAYVRFEELAMSAADLRSVFIAEARQNAFRINCFAEGVGVLLGGILAVIGLHGLCLLRGDSRAATDRTY